MLDYCSECVSAALYEPISVLLELVMSLETEVKHIDRCYCDV